MDYKDIIENLPPSIKDNPIYMVSLIAIMFLSYKISKIIEFFDSIKQRKINKLKEAETSGYLKGSSKKLVRSMLSEIYFTRATGLRLSKAYQDEFNKIYNKNGALTSLDDFKNAMDFIKMSGGVFIGVKIPLFMELPVIILSSFAIYSLYLIIKLLYIILILMSNYYYISDFADFLYLLGAITAVIVISFIIFYISIFKPWSKYKSCIRVNRQIGSNEATSWYEKSSQYCIKFSWYKAIIFLFFAIVLYGSYLFLYAGIVKYSEICVFIGFTLPLMYFGIYAKIRGLLLRRRSTRSIMLKKHRSKILGIRFVPYYIALGFAFFVTNSPTSQQNAKPTQHSKSDNISRCPLSHIFVDLKNPPPNGKPSCSPHTKQQT